MSQSLWDRFRVALVGIGKPIEGEQFEAQLDRGIRNADEQIKKAREARDTAKATRLHAKNKAGEVATAQKALEEQATVLLRARRKSKAQVVALDIAKLSEERAQWESRALEAKEEETAKELLIDGLEAQLRRLKYQLGVFRAAANLSRTQEALSRTQSFTASITDAIPHEKAKPPETADQILSRLDESAKKPGGKAKKNPSETSSTRTKR